jgi:hypothetical protein
MALTLLERDQTQPSASAEDEERKVLAPLVAGRPGLDAAERWPVCRPAQEAGPDEEQSHLEFLCRPVPIEDGSPGWFTARCESGRGGARPPGARLRLPPEAPEEVAWLGWAESGGGALAPRDFSMPAIRARMRSRRGKGLALPRRQGSFAVFHGLSASLRTISASGEPPRAGRSLAMAPASLRLGAPVRVETGGEGPPWRLMSVQSCWRSPAGAGRGVAIAARAGGAAMAVIDPRADRLPLLRSPGAAMPTPFLVRAGTEGPKPQDAGRTPKAGCGRRSRARGCPRPPDVTRGDPLPAGESPPAKGAGR